MSTKEARARLQRVTAGCAKIMLGVKERFVCRAAFR